MHMEIVEIAATLIVLILSIVLHEVAHGYAANWLGDPTARLAGRLSANPFVHIDPIGSVIVPAFMFFSSQIFVGHGLVFGWAKPVPYNPYNLSNQRWGEAIVAVAGPLTNFLLAAIFAVLIRMAGVFDLSASFVDLSAQIVFINVLLGCFNLIPMPPLDGSKVIEPFLPLRARQQYRVFGAAIERFGMIGSLLFIIILMQVFGGPFTHLVYTISYALMGA